MPAEQPVHNSLITNLIGVTLIGLLSWTVYTTNQTQQDLAVLTANVDNMENTLLIASTDRYTKTQSISDLALIYDRLDRLEKFEEQAMPRIRELEHK